ncbi:MAG: LLM class flavin-dependent oxidoreductase, partial [Candidatus Limnocylindrales bacterium]|nr:LLM class flavin-dependent oxidoreductase [Candidatus Limnocylindrales bacterium]
MPAEAGAGRRLPIGVCLRAIRAEPLWWLESARRLDAAGYAGLWSWDHFMGRGDLRVPVVEGWTILSMAAAATGQATVGPFVLNVMNRHPAVVARMASTLQIASGGRLVLGIGIGGAPREHA